MKGYANRVLDRAERTGVWFACLAGINTGIGIGWLARGSGRAWPFLAAGLVLFAIRPAGTSLRRHLRIRQLRRQIASYDRAAR